MTGGMVAKALTQRQSTSDWQTPPADGWQRKRRLWVLLMAPVLMVGLLTIVVSAEVVRHVQGGTLPIRYDLILASTGLALVGSLVVAAFAWRSLWAPLYHLRNWAARVRGGNLSARMPTVVRGEFAELAADVNSLGETLQRLSQEEQGLPTTIRVLEILHDITADIASSPDLEELLPRFLYTLQGAIKTRAGAVRLLTADGHLRLAASVGLPDDVVAKERLISADCCLCGYATQSLAISMGSDLKPCCTSWGRSLFADEDLVLLAIPLRYEGRTTGLYNLFIERQRVIGQKDIEELLLSVGQHLGAAIERARLQDERRQLSLIQERMAIAHELHDSLAQTLASLRIQARVLDEALENDGPAGVRVELKRLTEGLDVAHKEVRAIIHNWRVIGTEGGLLPALDTIINRFKVQTDIEVFLQKSWSGPLPATYETHVLRIIQESLCNVRKHAHARTVRVMLSADADGRHRVLIEDDGDGTAPATAQGVQDEHFGLAIVQERARHMGGEVRVEREPGEGTRVMLTFRYPETAARQPVPVMAVMP
ncbi:MAG: GAF domain-containing sensor histidine kinase [Acidiferrobacter sp.]